MHFGVSFGELIPDSHLEALIRQNYEAGDLSDIWQERQDAYLTQYIHINHPDDSVEAGFDFTGYDWNRGVLLRLEEDDTTSLVPCDFDISLDCSDYFTNGIVGERRGLILGDVVWYEDVPNLQLDLLGLGVPDMDAGDEVN
jgi:hypothetical protein